eukprot:7841214-Ditylum_brightwellii.AAC.1
MKNAIPFKGVVEGPAIVPNQHWALGHLKLLMMPDFRKGLKIATWDHADDKGMCLLWYSDRAAMSVLRAKDVKLVLTASST